ncbi:right-handed parallel beta-helix repeat-containing protein [Limibacter armeniacum]|uniref:right-handed parallel beta-helix repeat-containing protein n=1 Tax=Limibacter armeniacum TaxID=466084 RepID=UPI002FE4FD62
MKLNKLIVLIGLLMAHTASATNYYVAKSGADTNVGTLSAPFLTIAKASSMLSAGDTCFIMEGIYREVLQPQSNGEAGKPIVYTSYDGEDVLISATEILDTWEQHSGNIYKAAYTMTLGRQNMLFCNDKPMDWARWPNNEDSNPYTIDAWNVTSGTASSVESHDLPSHSWAGGYIWYLGAHSGTSWTREITSSTTTTVNFEGVDITKWPFNPHNPTVKRNNNFGRFYLMGVLDALDYEREWFYKDGYVYFQAPNNLNPSTLKVEVGARSKTINLNKTYVYVDGINTFGGKVDISADNCELRNTTITNGLQILDELDNTDAQVADAAVLVRSSYVTVSNNTIDGSSLNGVFVQGWGNKTNVNISNNYIRNCNTVGIHASPIRCSAPNAVIYGNTIQTTGRDGIYNGGSDTEIAYNDVSNCMLINNDGGVFYTVGNANDKNVVIHHNWFHDSEGPDYADGRAAGIYLDNNSKGYLVHHNVVWNVTWTGIQMNWDNWNIDIYNNSIYEVEGTMGRWENGYTLNDVVLKNNYGSSGEFIGTDISATSNLIDATNPFTDISAHDFRPHQDAAIIDAGEQIVGITDDYMGAAPDIGAYEYQRTPWRPGVNPVMGGEEDVPTALPQDSGAINWLMFPNPLDAPYLKIQTMNASKISIYDLTGRKVYVSLEQIPEHSIHKEVFPSSGLYVVQIQGENRTLSRKLLVQ